MDLSTISIDQLQAEIKNRSKPQPFAVIDGKKLYDPASYNRLLEYYDEFGVPKDFSPIEWNGNGSAKSVEPQEVVVNVEAFFSNRVYQKGKEFHIVIDTWSIREQETGDVTLAMIPEYVLKENAKFKEGYEIYRSSATREDFMKHYTDSFGTDNMIEIMRMINKNSEKLNSNATIELPDFKKSSKKASDSDSLIDELAAPAAK